MKRDSLIQRNHLMARPLRPAYLKQQLRLDPRQSAAHIIALRNTEIGHVCPAAANARLASQERLATPQSVASARSAIESIRNQFWNLPLEELNARLESIDLRPYPELANVVEQLKQAAAVRAEFPKLAQRLGQDLGLFHCVRQSVTMPPRDVAGMKESVIRSLLDGEKVHSYKATAKVIKEEFPLIYALQREWFDNILKIKPLARNASAQGTGFALGAPAWVIVLLFILLIRGCASLFQ